jgi:hypothetical protein
LAPWSNFLKKIRFLIFLGEKEVSQDNSDLKNPIVLLFFEGGSPINKYGQLKG